MTAPRQILNGTTYFLTRRCAQGQFLLHPDSITNQIFLYCLAYAARKYNIQVHAFCVMSNHWHAVLTDTQGSISEFTEWVHKYVAKSLNARYGRSENVWSCRPTSLIPLCTANDILAKVSYVLANPVRARLVHKARHWPGLWSDPALMGKVQTVYRPKLFFRPTGPMPNRVEWMLIEPPKYRESNYGNFVEAVTARLKHIQHEVRRMTTRVLGVTRLLKQKWSDYPRRSVTSGELNPQVAAQDQEDRIQLLKQLRAFRCAYREAWLKFKAGVQDVLFPAGTYWMKRFLNVRCSTC